MKKLIMHSRMNLNKLNGGEMLHYPFSIKNKVRSTTTTGPLPTNAPVQEILIISSYPPRECGVATYSQDLKNAISEKFGESLSVRICALENKDSNFNYAEEVKYRLNTSEKENYAKLATTINNDTSITSVFLEHEFGLFGGNYGEYAIELLSKLEKPVATTFHTVLPNPDKEMKIRVIQISNYSAEIIVMTKNSAAILAAEYGIAADKIKVIAHGTHLIAPVLKDAKTKIQFENRLVLSTFGLISEDKSIETALDALPKIVEKFPQVLYLIIGKTHPEVVKNRGEKYRDFLHDKVESLGL